MGIRQIALDELLTSDQVAEYLGLTPNALAIDRHRGRGIPYVRVGSRIRYRAKDVQGYLDANTVAG